MNVCTGTHIDDWFDDDVYWFLVGAAPYRLGYPGEHHGGQRLGVSSLHSDDRPTQRGFVGGVKLKHRI